MKYTSFDWPSFKGTRKPLLFIFNLDKSTGYVMFCGPETVHHKNIKKTSLSDSFTYYLKDDEKVKVDDNAEFWFSPQRVRFRLKW